MFRGLIGVCLALSLAGSCRSARLTEQPLDDYYARPNPASQVVVQESYWLFGAQLEDRSQGELVAALEGRLYDFGLMRRAFGDSRLQWSYGSWYLLSWQPHPSERFARVGGGTLLNAGTEMPMDGIAGDQSIPLPLGRGVDYEIAVTGLSSAFAELSAIPYHEGQLLMASEPVYADIEGSLRSTSEYGFAARQSMYLVRSDRLTVPDVVEEPVAPAGTRPKFEPPSGHYGGDTDP